MNRIAGLALIALTFAAALSLCGCAHEYAVVNGFSEEWKFYDINMPEDCDYIQRESFTYISPGWPNFRVGKGVFVGETRCDTVAGEFRDFMPKHGFEIVKDDVGPNSDPTTLVFYNSVRNENVEAKISRDVQNRIHVTVLVGPKPR